MNKLKSFACIIVFLSITGFGPLSFLFGAKNSESFGTQAWIEKEATIISSQASNIDSEVLHLALKAYVNAHHKGRIDKQLLTIIDYEKPSSDRRMWVIDLKKQSVLYNTWVSHGKNSGSANATSFSNQPGSLKSSYGVFVTESPYMGGNGYSLRLIGLEAGINDNAYNRDIVIHGAWYVDPSVAKRYGQLGRSWGCPAVSERLAKPLINTIKENTLVFAYYPDKKWIKRSPYLVG